MAEDLDFDALARRYAEERDKRVRGNGMAQWVELKRLDGDWAKDPYADPDFDRAPLTEEVDALVIGGGFAGLLAGARLREQGVEKLRIVEIGADFGGTWYWNRYPGVACDVESYIYLPMVEELGVMPSQKYARGSEIYEHCQRLARHYDLYSAALFQTAAETAEWDEKRQRWAITTSRGDKISARFLISCAGLLSNPKMANIPGVDSFRGHCFHTSRWDYAYTGGDQHGNMTGLKDKRVGIIGTGATAVQAVPYLGESAKHLYVFQRTPTSIDIRGNRPTDPEWVKTLEPGWARARRDNFNMACAGIQVDDMVGDGWTDIMRHTRIIRNANPASTDPEELSRAGMRKMERVRERIDSVVKDKSTAEALKPFYHYFCKRPGFHDEYLETFNRSNVTLVDTKGVGVERITENAVVVDGTAYEIDCLIYATGFEWLTDYERESGVDFVGRGGVKLSEHWSDGPRTLYGIQTHNFPNLFFMRQVQSGASINYVHTADEQTRHIAFVIAECLSRGIAAVEPTHEAEEDWVRQIEEGAASRASFQESCTPGYYNFEGEAASRKRARTGIFMPGPLVYNRTLEEWRNDPAMRGLVVTAG